MMLAHFILFAFVLSKLSYFFIAGTPYFITAGLLLLLAFFIFAFPRLKKVGKRISAIGLSVIVMVICLTTLFHLTIFNFQGGAVVFAVDEEYQIAFATSHQSIGYVVIDGTTYYDQTNGQNNVNRLHKISIPATLLDEKKNYEIHAVSVALNTAYLPSQGAKLSQSYTFRPVDTTDGIQMYNLSDTHECLTGPINAASYWGDKLDILILNGDIINDVSSYDQIAKIYRLAYGVTNGTRPVLYVRGNHECNGSLSADFGRYVGCADRGFYYTYRVGELSLVVLDTANDMSDDNLLIRPLANFDVVREQESLWLKGLGDWSKDYTYPLVIAHMAYPLKGYTSESCSWNEWARELISLTDSQAKLAVCGHSHKLDYALPAEGGDNNLSSYPVLRGSLRSNDSYQVEGISPLTFTGTAIECKGGNITMQFTNAKGKVLKTNTLAM
jgi:hypothetical protein